MPARRRAQARGQAADRAGLMHPNLLPTSMPRARRLCARQAARAESGISPGLQLCRGGLPVLCPALPGLAPPPTAFPGAPWVSSFFPLLGVSGSLCILATAHTEGHICNANVRLAQENRVHPTCPYVCRVLLAGTPLPACTQAAGSGHPQHHRHCPQPLVSTASN